MTAEYTRDTHSRAVRNPSLKKSINPDSVNVSTTLPQHLLHAKSGCSCGGGCPACRKGQVIQAKLKVGAASDQYEQEADRVADQVMRMPESHQSSLDRQLAQENSITCNSQNIQRVSNENQLNLDTPVKQNAHSMPEVSPSVMAKIRSLQGGGQPLAKTEQSFFEPRMGVDFSQVRIHKGAQAAELALSLNARAFTLGENVVFGEGEYSSQSNTGRKLLAHELTHVVQQNGTAGNRSEVHNIQKSPFDSTYQTIQRDLLDPDRLATVHQNVMVQGPPRQTSTGVTTSRHPWVDPADPNWTNPADPDAGTAGVLYRQIFRFLNLRTFRSGGPAVTTDANLDADAVAMHQRVLAYFPQVSSPLSDPEIHSRVGLLEPATVSGDNDYLNDWMDNFIEQMSNSEDYQINTRNTAYRDMIQRLVDHPAIRPKILTLGASQPAYTSGEGRARQIFVNRDVTVSRRQPTLIHEIIHLYRHQHYADWIPETVDELHYTEGLTEWLAYKVMTAVERSTRTGTYHQRVATVDNQIAAHVSEDGIAQAYFNGDVWRLETRSQQARDAFAADSGIQPGSTAAQEGAASRSGAGLFQTVVAGSHYRFVNLGRDRAQPKAEHVAAFQRIKTTLLDTNPGKQVRFVGHASGPGSDAHNRILSRRRALAFYQMAEREGLLRSHMIDASNPVYMGESQPSLTEEGDAITRAMNRRVEMFLVG